MNNYDKGHQHLEEMLIQMRPKISGRFYKKLEKPPWEQRKYRWESSILTSTISTINSHKWATVVLAIFLIGGCSLFVPEVRSFVSNFFDKLDSDEQKFEPHPDWDKHIIASFDSRLKEGTVKELSEFIEESKEKIEEIVGFPIKFPYKVPFYYKEITFHVQKSKSTGDFHVATSYRGDYDENGIYVPPQESTAEDFEEKRVTMTPNLVLFQTTSDEKPEISPTTIIEKVMIGDVEGEYKAGWWEVSARRKNGTVAKQKWRNFTGKPGEAWGQSITWQEGKYRFYLGYGTHGIEPKFHPEKYHMTKEDLIRLAESLQY